MSDPHLEPWWMSGWPESTSPSQLGRLAACIRSDAMPHAFSGSPFATKGTIAHKYLADVLEHGEERAMNLVEDPEDRDWLAMIDLAALPAFHPMRYAPEVALAYDPRTRTARELGRNLSRDQARALARPGEIVGILDVFGVTEDTAVVGDYKTGYGYVEPAEANWQLRTYALFAARSRGLPKARHSIIRTRDNGRTWFDSADMDELDMMAHEEEFLSLLERREKVRALAREGKWAELPPFNIGKQCRYCPALWACPAQGGVIARYLGGSRTITPEQAAEAWRELQVASKAIELRLAILKDMARQQPIPLEDGHILGERQVPREAVVPERAMDALVELWGDVGRVVYGESAETETSLTKAALRRNIKKFVLPTLPKEEAKITHVEKAALEHLRMRKAISVTMTKRVEEYRPAGPVKTEEPLPVEHPEPEASPEEAA